MLTLLRLFFACLTAIGYKPMIYQDFTISSKQSDDLISEVEVKQKKNYYTDFGYLVVNIDELCSGTFINKVIDIYSPASIIYSPPYVDFQFDIISSNIFSNTRYVSRVNFNGTDFGYSTGTSISSVVYKCNTLNRTLSGYVIYSNWSVIINGHDYSRFNLFSYDGTSYDNFGFDYEISGGDLNGILVSEINRYENPLYDIFVTSNDSYNFGYSNGYYDGREEGRQVGYSEGIVYAQEQDSTALTIFTGILEVGLLPVNVFLKFFEYEVFGINIAGLISGVVTVALIMILIRFIFGGKENGQ